MNNYEKIKAIIKSGHKALCQHKDGKYEMYSTILDDGNITCSCKQISIEDCIYEYEYIDDSEEEINSCDFKSIRPYVTIPPILKAGDLVEILDVSKDFTDSCSGDKKDMIGKGPFEIQEVRDSASGICYLIWDKYKTLKYTFPHYMVCLWTGDEKVETITIGGVEYNKADFEAAVKDLKPIK